MIFEKGLVVKLFPDKKTDEIDREYIWNCKKLQIYRKNSKSIVTNDFL